MAINTVSLQTAKALKTAGFNQNSDFAYSCNHFDEAMAINKGDAYSVHYKPSYRRDFAAPTTDELLEELIAGIQITKHAKLYRVVKGGRSSYGFTNESLPEALAEMWMWLKKEGLL